MKPAPAARPSPAARRAAQPAAASPARSAAASERAPDVVPSRRTLGLGLVGSALLWAALPPLGLWPLAWIAPVPWLLLVEGDRLAGRRPYLALWLAGLGFWLGALHWLRLPHPATSIGWVAMSAYLGCYLPVCVGLSRVAVHRVGCSLVIAAPVVWTAAELVQSHLLTGVNIATLGHTQYRWIELLQVSDLAGGYGVSFIVMFVAAAAVRAWPSGGRRWAAWPGLAAAGVLGAALAYGQYRTAGDHGRPVLKVALIQGSIDTEVKADPNSRERIHEQYLGLTRQALRAHRDVDLVVWPETMYRDPLLIYADDVHPPPGEDWERSDLERAIDERRDTLRQVADLFGVPMLLGVDTLRYGPGVVDRYNSAALVDRQGEVRGRYDKMRPVMFGEYIPLGDYWPWLYRLTPLENGIRSGARPEAFEVDGVRLAPNICFESLLPHFIRGQVAELRARGEEPDALVNLTNDGWFWGSSELDLHLICGVFRAVECRKPLLIAANTGFSASIDAAGRIRERGPRRATGFLIAEVRRDDRSSPYVRYGDLPAGACLLFAGAMATIGGWDLLKRRHAA